MFVDDGKTPVAEDGEWMTRDEVAKVCPPCAEKMKERNILRIRASLLFRPELQRAILYGEGGECKDCGS